MTEGIMDMVIDGGLNQQYHRSRGCSESMLNQRNGGTS